MIEDASSSRSRTRRFSQLLVICCLVLLATTIPNAFAVTTSNGQPAGLALGQANYTAATTTQSSMNQPLDITADPPTIPDLDLWLDASDPDGDGNAANNPADGAALTTWVDKSAGANNATVAVGRNAGTYSSSGGELINGQPSVRFTRVSQSQGSVYNVAGVDIRAGITEDVTIITVYRPKTIAPPSTGLWGIDNGAWDRFFLNYHAGFGDGVDDGIAALGPVQQGKVVPDAGQVGVVRLMTAVYNGTVTGGVNSGPVNGSTIYFDGKVVARFTDSTDDLAAQSSFFIGWDGNDGAYDGDIAEILVYNRALSISEIQQVNSYLGTKYGKDFTFTAPGGVSGASLWLKGSNVTVAAGNVSAWPDQSGSSLITTEASKAASAEVTLQSDLTTFNFNPAVRFTGATDETLIGTASTAFNTAPTIFAVARATANPGGSYGGVFSLWQSADSLTAAGYGIVNYSQPPPIYVADANGAPVALSTSPALNQTLLVRVTYANNTDANGATTSINGKVEATSSSAIPLAPHTDFEIGGRTAGRGTIPSYGQRTFVGDIAEVIYYPSILSAAEKQSIESYLAIKYGITLDSALDYLASDGTTVIWDKTANSAYYNDVAGIGVDSASILSQLQSRSINSDDIVTIAGSAANISSGEFLLWGNDGATITSTTQLPAGDQKRLLREWKTQEISETGALTVSFDLSSFSDPLFSNVAGFALLVDDDGDFSNATAVTGATVNGTTVSFSNVALANGQYFSLAYPIVDITAPAAPTVTAPADGATVGKRPTISGTAEPGSTITVKEGATTICTATTQPDGSWSCVPSADLAEGAHTLSITASDASNNISPAATRSFVVDGTAPAAPTVAAPADGAAVGSKRPTISGTAEPGSTITVKEGATTICTATAQSDGSWSCVPTADLAEGAHTLSITATDTAGNISSTTARSFTVSPFRIYYFPIIIK